MVKAMIGQGFMRKIFLLTAAIVLIVGVPTALWRIGSSTTFQFFGRIVPRVETPERIVALTFDDGPTPGGTQKILALLAEQHVRATFFLIGSELEKNMEAGRKIVEAGHEVGNHSYSHHRMLLSTPSFVRQEVERTDELIRQTGYDKDILFRPPYGKKLFSLPWFLSKTGRTTVMWDVAPESDPKIDGNADRIVENVLSETRPGSIILLHVMYKDRTESLNAVRSIIEGLKKDGYRLVTVSEMIRSRQSI
jgi:peptidoglycan-N-acetylglucosamine deacetylase